MMHDGDRPFGLIADVHSNRQALDQALAYFAQHGIEEVYCLGDIVGYGGDPGYCVERVREACRQVVAGNHDVAVASEQVRARFNPGAREAIEAQAELLSEDDTSYLMGLPRTLHLGDVMLSHSGFRQPEAFHYVQTREDAQREFEALTKPLGAIGHTHVPAVFRQSTSGEIVRLLGRDPLPGRTATGPRLEELDVPLGRAGRIIVNPGAVGQPRDRDPRAALGVVEPTSRSFRLVRLAYDIAGAQDAIRRNGMPLVQAGRLLLGV